MNPVAGHRDGVATTGAESGLDGGRGVDTTLARGENPELELALAGGNLNGEGKGVARLRRNDGACEELLLEPMPEEGVAIGDADDDDGE